MSSQLDEVSEESKQMEKGIKCREQKTLKKRNSTSHVHTMTVTRQRKRQRSRTDAIAYAKAREDE